MLLLVPDIDSKGSTIPIPCAFVRKLCLKLRSYCCILNMLLTNVLRFKGIAQESVSLQGCEARAVQCESDITFQRGQVRQSYIGTVCVQLQQHMATYMTAAVTELGEPAEGVHPAAVDLVTSLVEIQADLVSLAPLACITQVRPTLTQPCVSAS